MESVIRSAGRALTASALARRAERAAGGFRDLGAGEGAAVALLLRNDLASFEAVAGARLAGATAVPLNWHLHPEEIAWALGDCGARVLVAHADLLAGLGPHLPAGVEALAVDTPPEIAAAYGIDPVTAGVAGRWHHWEAWLAAQTPVPAPAEPPGTVMLYTSGTTGRPKGVRRAPLAPDAQTRYLEVLAESFGLRAGLRGLMTGPLYHSAPFAFAQVGLWLGCELILMPRFEPAALLALIERERITHLHMVPTMFVRLLRLPAEVRARHDLSSLECVCHGAAPCPPEVKRAMIEWWGPVFREYYGSTEASLISNATSEEWLARPGTVGRPHRLARVEIRDDEGRALGPGEPGEIWARLEPAPPFTYHNRPEDRAAIERDGLLTNGDVGYLDEDGYLYLCDRKRDMVISGGVNIYPAEIESVLLAHPAVRDCAVFGAPDEEFGERVVAAVEPMPGTDLRAEALREHLSAHLARYKVPGEIVFHEALPRLDNGKIYKRRLREPYWAGRERRI